VPPRRQFFIEVVEGSVLANDLVFRDGLARVARARGDLRGAIEIYRRLLLQGPDQNWVALFEPRYVLARARLLEKAGDAETARAEYERFLQFWKQADADLPDPGEARRALSRLANY
jgi:tetratricopeptide (TPR) repeat protein